MVALLQAETGIRQVGEHDVAQVDVVVGWGYWEVPALGSDFMTQVGAAVRLGLRSGVPPTECRVDLVERLIGARVEADRVEDVELGFRAEVGSVRDARADQVVLRLA